MEIHQLRYFLAVVRTRNFSRAAEQCHVAQPSLSLQIKKLEEELGERLFQRTKREVTVTPAGELFSEHAEHVLEEIELGREKVREVRGQIRGKVALGALPTIAPYFLPTRLREFSTRYPEVEVVVHEDTTTQLAEMVLAKEIDMALVSLPVGRRGLQSETLFEEDLLVALPAKHRLAQKKRLELADLKDEAFIVMKEEHCLSGQTMQFCQLRGFSPKVSFRSAQIETMLSFVLAGWGVSIVPAMALSSEGARGLKLQPLGNVQRTIGVIFRASRPLSQAAKRLLTFFRPRDETPKASEF